MRLLLLALAALAIAAGCWLIVPSTGAGSATLAARIAAVRGDLWAEAAIQKAASPSLGGARGDAERALRLSPLRADQWLLLAADGAGTADARENALTLAYFTGAGVPAIIPERLDLAGRFLALDQPELCDLVRADVSFEARQGAKGMAVLKAAYASARPTNRVCIDDIVHTIDPQLSLAP